MILSLKSLKSHFFFNFRPVRELSRISFLITKVDKEAKHNENRKKNLFIFLTFLSFSTLKAQDKEEFISKLEEINGADDKVKSQQLYNKGVAKMEGKEYSQAIELFNKSLKLNADFAEVYLNRGVSYLKVGQKEKGMADLVEAIFQNPKLDKAYFSMAKEFEKNNELDKSIENYTKSIDLIKKSTFIIIEEV